MGCARSSAAYHTSGSCLVWQPWQNSDWGEAAAESPQQWRVDGLGLKGDKAAGLDWKAVCCRIAQTCTAAGQGSVAAACLPRLSNSHRTCRIAPEKTVLLCVGPYAGFASLTVLGAFLCSQDRPGWLCLKLVNVHRIQNLSLNVEMLAGQVALQVRTKALQQIHGQFKLQRLDAHLCIITSTSSKGFLCNS